MSPIPLQAQRNITASTAITTEITTNMTASPVR
nr:MAG TPA: hypothetical protein [Caudoviricetes sp.]